MEFFREVPIETSEAWIYENFTLANFSQFSTQLFVLEQQSEHEAQIGGIWGEFTLQMKVSTRKWMCLSTTGKNL